MSTLAERMKSRAGKAHAGAPPSQLNSGEGVAAEEATPAATGATKAPWYGDPCVACAKNPVPGFSKTGKPCKVCDAANRKAGKPTSNLWLIGGDDKGNYSWEPVDPKSGLETGGAGDWTPEVEAKKGKTEATPPADEAEEEEAEEQTPEATPPADEPEEEQTEPEEKPKAKAKKGRGRPPTPFTLYINCRPTRGPATKKVVDLGTIVQRLQDDIAADPSNHVNGEPVSFFALNPFQRRDALVSHAKVVVEELPAASAIVATSRGTLEYEYLLNALRGLDCYVVEGLS